MVLVDRIRGGAEKRGMRRDARLSGRTSCDCRKHKCAEDRACEARRGISDAVCELSSSLLYRERGILGAQAMLGRLLGWE
eukprot:6040372-Pleurochrysis_carterae.AAC.1